MLTQGADGKLEDVNPCIQVEAEVDVQPVHCAHQVLLPVHHLRQISLWNTAASEVPFIQDHEDFDKHLGGFPNTIVTAYHLGSHCFMQAAMRYHQHNAETDEQTHQQSVQGVNEGDGNPAL